MFLLLFSTVILLLSTSSVLNAEAAPELETNPRVIGGLQAKEGEFPYLAQIRIINSEFEYSPYRNLICGGSIIHQEYILTAAQCVYDKWASEIYVSVGSVVIGRGWDISVRRIVLRDPYFRPGDSSADIALVQLNYRLEFHEIYPISYIGGIYEPEILNATGWGWPLYSGGISPALEYMTLSTATNALCEELGWGSRITADKICTMRSNNKGICGVDIGGPLTYYGLQIGVIGWTQYDCDSTAPDVHTRVSPYANWISNIISGRYSGFCTERTRFNEEIEGEEEKEKEEGEEEKRNEEKAEQKEEVKEEEDVEK